MTRWRFTFDVDMADYADRRKLFELMSDAAASYGCDVREWVSGERVDPPLREVESYGGKSGD